MSQLRLLEVLSLNIALNECSWEKNLRKFIRLLVLPSLMMHRCLSKISLYSFPLNVPTIWGKTLDGYLINLENFQALKSKIVFHSLWFSDFKLSLRINPLTFFEKVYIKEIYVLAEAKSGILWTN